MAVLRINYDDGSKTPDLGYKGVELITRNKHTFKFESGNFVKDWFEAKKKYIDFAEDELFLSHSSSVNHFIMDGANFDSAWLIWDNDTTNPRLVYEFDENGWEMFVPKGTKPTWEELKYSIGYGKQKLIN